MTNYIANFTLSEPKTINATFKIVTVTEATGLSYNDLDNRPSINDVILTGNKTSTDLGLAAQSTTYTKNEVDTLIDSIPTPDVSGQISVHNTSNIAHSDIRTLISNEVTRAQSVESTKADKTTTYTKTEVDSKISAIPTPDVSAQITAHNTDTSSHSDIRTLITNEASRAQGVEVLKANQADLAAEISRAQAAEALKVDKVDGKGLSTNDFTNALLTLLNQQSGTNTGDETKERIIDKLGLYYTQAVPAGTTIYVSTTGSDVLGIGTNENPYATINKALAYFDGKMLLGNVYIQIKDGTYNNLASVTIDHPQSKFINIQGNTSNKANVVLNFATNGFIVNSFGCYIKYSTINGSGTSAYGGVQSYASTIVSNCIINNFKNGLYATTGKIYYDALTTTNCSNGWYSSGSGGIIAGDYNTGTNTISSCTTGLKSLSSGSLYVANPGGSVTVTGATTGVSCERMSIVLMGSGVSITGTTALYANFMSYMYAAGATINGAITPAVNTLQNNGSFIQA